MNGVEMPNMTADQWKDYELLDAGDGERLERWGVVTLRRPDPQILWPVSNPAIWDKADAHYHRSDSGGGKWEYRRRIPDSWKVSFGDLTFIIQPTGFKHTGLFPEQSVNWDWMRKMISSRGSKPTRVLNLFGYTGAASVACTAAGAEVCHVDAAKGMVEWAKENFEASGLREKPVRFFVDDVVKFVKREIRREKRYEGILLDPPSYGRGTKGETWKIEKHLYPLLEICADLLSDEPLFFLINSYTTGLSPTVLENLLKCLLLPKIGGRVESGEVGLPVKASGLILPCGIFARWCK